MGDNKGGRNIEIGRIMLMMGFAASYNIQLGQVSIVFIRRRRIGINPVFISTGTHMDNVAHTWTMGSKNKSRNKAIVKRDERYLPFERTLDLARHPI